ncbi:uncharacterized [Tachysurus ichikawai]
MFFFAAVRACKHSDGPRASAPPPHAALLFHTKMAAALEPPLSPPALTGSSSSSSRASPVRLTASLTAARPQIPAADFTVGDLRLCGLA